MIKKTYIGGEEQSIESEPYMGVMRAGRCSGSAPLFDSDIEHQHFISVSIAHADRRRDLSRNWISPGEEIVEVLMSEMQWANFVSSFNHHDGVPVTLHHIMCKSIAEPPRPKREASKFQDEVAATATKSVNALEARHREAESGTGAEGKGPGQDRTGLDSERP